MELYYKCTSNLEGSYHQICVEYEATKKAASGGLIDNDESNMKRQFRQRIKRLMENGVLLVSKETYNLPLQTIFLKNPETYSEDCNLILKHQPQKRDLWNVIDKGKVVWEYMVPATVLVEYVWERLGEGNFTIDEFRGLRAKYGSIALICKEEEDKKLNNAGLRQKMPKGWKIGDSEYARYQEVGIEIM